MTLPRIALFDLDHTLLPLDSDHAWGEFCIRIGWCDAADFKARNDAFYAAYQAGTLDIHAYVRFATAAIVARGATESIAAQAEYMSLVIENAIKPEARALVAGHRAAGDRVAIVTATNEFVTRPIAQAFGVEQLIAVELARSAGEGGWYTGAIAGTPSFREGKIARVEQWLAGQGLSLATVEATFYSDSMNDLPLLERVAHPVATNPEPRLAALAAQRGWRILDLFAPS